MESNFNGCKPDNFVSLKNSGALHLDVKLFGIPFTILTATSVATYDSHGPAALQPSKKSADGNNPKVVIKIFQDQDNSITVTLRANSKKDIQQDETGPGFYSPGDWGFAFG
jgi:hypothetical protein